MMSLDEVIKHSEELAKDIHTRSQIGEGTEDGLFVAVRQAVGEKEEAVTHVACAMSPNMLADVIEHIFEQMPRVEQLVLARKLATVMRHLSKAEPQLSPLNPFENFGKES